MSSRAPEAPEAPDAPDAGQPVSAPAAWADGDPGERGGLKIAPLVIARIAETAARDVPEIVSVSRSVFGLPLGTRQAARVRASVHATRTQLQMTVAIQYPADVAAVAEQVRRTVAARVGELAGMAVLEVAISVERLTTAAPPPRLR